MGAVDLDALRRKILRKRTTVVEDRKRVRGGGVRKSKMRESGRKLNGE